jgi:NDP-sugar pyrophosphorylase family protein
VILAGGQGTRLRPLTLARAKPVVPVLNRPFLAWQLALLRKHGVTDVVLACSYRVDDVRSALGEAEHLGVRLRYVIEAEPLGTGGGVRNAADLASGTVFVLNGDVLSDVDLSAMRAFHEARRSRTTIFLTRVSDPRQYGLVETAADGRLRRFREKPAADEPITTDTINAGIYLLDAALLAQIPSGRNVSIEREFFPALIADGTPAYGWISDAYWRDIGSPTAYRAAHVDLLAGKARMPLAPPGEPRDGCWLDARTHVATGAQLAAPAVLGPEVTVQAGARVGPVAVLGERCRIGAGTRVEGAVLWEHVEVGAHSSLRDCVIGADVHIGADVEIGPGVVLESGAVIPDHTRLTTEPRAS